MSKIIYGKNPVIEYLRTGTAVERILIAKGTRTQAIQNITQLAKLQGIKVEFISRTSLTQKVRHPHHQGIAAVVKDFGYVAVEDILDIARQRSEPPVIALLDGIQDPHNLGAIIRSADGAGIHGIIIPKDNSVAVTPTVEKVSAGATAFVPIAQVTNLARTMEELKEAGLWFYGADQHAQQTVYEVDFRGAIGMVLGSEGQGMRKLIQASCDFLIRIPMYGKLNSLNVSVSAAVVFFEIRKQRQFDLPCRTVEE